MNSATVGEDILVVVGEVDDGVDLHGQPDERDYGGDEQARARCLQPQRDLQVAGRQRRHRRDVCRALAPVADGLDREPERAEQAQDRDRGCDGPMEAADEESDDGGDGRHGDDTDEQRPQRTSDAFVRKAYGSRRYSLPKRASVRVRS